MRMGVKSLSENHVTGAWAIAKRWPSGLVFRATASLWPGHPAESNLRAAPVRKRCGGRRSGLLAALAVCALAAGCGREEIDDYYGLRAGKSVNGTGVLARMFEKAGHQVRSADRLSPRLAERADCIVWFPDDFRPPKAEVRDWLEKWLDGRPGRTLVYVGRDFDAARWYWEKIAPEVPPDERDAHQRRLAAARTSFDLRRMGLPRKEHSSWFDIDRKPAHRTVQKLSGDAEWLAGIDPAKLSIELESRLTPARDAEVLLASKGETLVSRQWIGEGQMIVVANGSFLLNLPLVNHEHRKLAAKLIDVVTAEDQEGQVVVFLESHAGGPPISGEDEDVPNVSDALEIFNVWPTNWILMHLAVVGLLLCFWRFPIFGLPRPDDPPHLSDFGKHLDAVGELLKQSGDEDYARERIRQYLQKTTS
jgi:hypothetical protein